jgi:hypothetical protein
MRNEEDVNISADEGYNVHGDKNIYVFNAGDFPF